MSKLLSQTEALALKACEYTIEKGFATFVQVGNALLEIRDEKLYRQDYGTFEEYCRQRWGIERAHAYRLINASKVAGNVSPIGDIQPTSESQVRPLAKLEPEEQREVWEKATQANPNPTAKQIRVLVTNPPQEIIRAFVTVSKFSAKDNEEGELAKLADYMRYATVALLTVLRGLMITQSYAPQEEALEKRLADARIGLEKAVLEFSEVAKGNPPQSFGEEAGSM
jgi:hypothetical protein